MQVADTTTTDENDEEVETVMRITTGGEAIPYFIGAVVDHNPSNVAEGELRFSEQLNLNSLKDIIV